MIISISRSLDARSGLLVSLTVSSMFSLSTEASPRISWIIMGESKGGEEKSICLITVHRRLLCVSCFCRDCNDFFL